MIYTGFAVIEKEGDWYVASCPDLDIASQGHTVEEAQSNLREAVQLFLENADPKEIPPHSESPFVTTFQIAI